MIEGYGKESPKMNFLRSPNLEGIDPSRTLLTMLSMRSHVGSVEIGPKAMGFEMKANREGFLNLSLWTS